MLSLVKFFYQILFQKFFSFYVQSSLHVGLAVVCLLTITHLEFDWSLTLPLVVFVFCSTVLTYNFIRYATAAPSYFFVKGKWQKSIRALSYLCGMVCVLCCIYLPLSFLWVAFGLGVISFLYVFPLTTSSRGFRNVKHVKTMMVATVWASVSVVLPWVTNEVQWTSHHLIFWCQMFCWTLATLIPFEIRDMQWDDPSIRTLPQSIGISGAKLVGYLAVGGVFVLELWRSMWEWTAVLGTAVVCLVVVGMLWNTKAKQTTYYAAFWVESLPVVWLLIKTIEKGLGI